MENQKLNQIYNSNSFNNTHNIVYTYSWGYRR